MRKICLKLEYSKAADSIKQLTCLSKEKSKCNNPQKLLEILSYGTINRDTIQFS